MSRVLSAFDSDSIDPAAGAVALRKGLLRWYGQNRRALPWRRTKDPYAIWVSEIMLQQTRVAAVIDRYEAFMVRFPTVRDLADANEQDVLAQWSGLGYYRRARMLHEAAIVVSTELDGVVPSSADALRVLPGVGAYTSAAIASIAFGEPVAVVDGNVERVVQRLAGWGSDLRNGQAALARQITSLANELLDPAQPGDFNQAMMELGATVCLPRNPMCLVCPIRSNCKTRGEHPTLVRQKMSVRDAAFALVLRNNGGHRDVLLDQRQSTQTVMPGLWELPTLRDPEVSKAHLYLTLRHSIMQVNYSVRIRSVAKEEAEALTVHSDSRRWVGLHEVHSLPLTGLARKVLMRAGACK